MWGVGRGVWGVGGGGGALENNICGHSVWWDVGLQSISIASVANH